MTGDDYNHKKLLLFLKLKIEVSFILWNLKFISYTLEKCEGATAFLDLPADMG